MDPDLVPPLFGEKEQIPKILFTKKSTMRSPAWSFRVPKVDDEFHVLTFLLGIQQHPQVLSTAWTFYRSILGHWVLEGDIILDDTVDESVMTLFVPGAIWSTEPRPLLHDYIYVKP